MTTEGTRVCRDKPTFYVVPFFCTVFKTIFDFFSFFSVGPLESVVAGGLNYTHYDEQRRSWVALI